MSRREGKLIKGKGQKGRMKVTEEKEMQELKTNPLKLILHKTVFADSALRSASASSLRFVWWCPHNLVKRKWFCFKLAISVLSHLRYCSAGHYSRLAGQRKNSIYILHLEFAAGARSTVYMCSTECSVWLFIRYLGPFLFT